MDFRVPDFLHLKDNIGLFWGKDSEVGKERTLFQYFPPHPPPISLKKSSFA